MLEKISNMERNDKFKLTIVFILLVFTIIIAVAPLINKHKNYTREELREKVKDTAWERKTENGTEARVFTQFGDYLIADLDKNRMLTSKSYWLRYEIVNKNTMNLSKYELPPRYKKYAGDYKIYLIDDNTIKINGVKYKKTDLRKWLDIGYDITYWKTP